MFIEPLTLTAEERVALSWGVHDARSGGLPLEDCTGCGPIADRLGPVIERILATREQALREEIAGAIEAHEDQPLSRGFIPKMLAAHIARGGSR